MVFRMFFARASNSVAIPVHTYRRGSMSPEDLALLHMGPYKVTQGHIACYVGVCRVMGHPKPSTLTLNPKPLTLNPKPLTLNR